MTTVQNKPYFLSFEPVVRLKINAKVNILKNNIE